MTELQIRTNLYTGPLDLLLWLVRRAEVDINDLPVAEIAEQYIIELEAMERVDLGFAGEYLVMAAQLLKIKSEFVLHAASEKGGEDPRKSLVRQLLEYRMFRDAALGLAGRQAEMLRRHPRPDGLVPEHHPDDVYLDEVNAYDLYRHHARLMREITPNVQHHVVLDEMPIEEYIRLILMQLQKGGVVDFSALLAAAPKREKVIGNFLAVLELVKQQVVDVDQDGAAIVVKTKDPNAKSAEIE
jgi:segregation and condensation protein A